MSDWRKAFWVYSLITMVAVMVAINALIIAARTQRRVDRIEERQCR